MDMDYIFYIIGACGILSLIFMLYLRHRVEMIRQYRHKLLDDILMASLADIVLLKDSEWRDKVYDSVSYGQMLWKFWRGLDSFYPDKSFTIADPVTDPELIGVMESIKKTTEDYIKERHVYSTKIRIH